MSGYIGKSVSVGLMMIFTMVTSSTRAQNHLEPEDFAIFSGMSLSFWGKFPELTPFFHKGVLAVQVVEHGMILGPLAVGIEQDGATSYRIFGVKRETKESSLQKYCTTPISGSLPQRLVKGWTAVLMGTRYSREPYMGADGAIFHYAVQGRGQVLSGKIWSPQLPTQPALLMRISFVLLKACEAHSLTQADRGEIEDYLSRIR